MRVLVTGASGFVGSHVARYLKESGHGILAVARHNSKFLSDLKDIKPWYVD